MNSRNGKSGGPKKPAAKLGQKPRAQKIQAAKTVEKSFAFELEDKPRLNKPRSEKKAQPLNDMRLGEFTIDRLSHDGRGITQWNGKTLFVDSALPGERVSARLVQDHSRFAEARIEKLLCASGDRITPYCVHANECGGCQLQHLKEEQHILFKQTTVLQQLEAWGGVTPKKILPPILSASVGYRRCARLGVQYGTDEIILGFRKRNTNQLVQVDVCSVLAPSLNKLLAPLKLALRELISVASITHVELIHSDDCDAMIVRHIQPLAEQDIAKFKSLAADFQVAIWLQGSEQPQLRDLSGAEVDPRLSYRLPDYEIELDFHPQDFVQVNAEVNQAMVVQALTLLALKSTDRVLDLFCGIGNFTLPIARSVASVIGIEAQESMVQRGRENAAKMGLSHVEFLAANLATMTEHRLKQTCGKVDALLLDPPRDGAKEIITKLSQLSPKRIVYVSCNPATLARDAKVLIAAGYQLESLGVLDMFPQTAHVESMALFVRR